jgi:hypothetical protein
MRLPKIPGVKTNRCVHGSQTTKYDGVQQSSLRCDSRCRMRCMATCQGPGCEQVCARRCGCEVNRLSVWVE